MKTIAVFVLALCLTITIAGCGKHDASTQAIVTPLVGDSSAAAVPEIVATTEIDSNEPETQDISPQMTNEVYIDPAPPLKSGLERIHISGLGYRLGDKVKIATDTGRISQGDIVLFDWRRAYKSQGFGPYYMVGKVIELQTRRIMLSEVWDYRSTDGKYKRLHCPPYPDQGVESYDDHSFTLSPGYCLLEVDEAIVIIDRVALGARIIALLGHDPDMENYLRSIAY